MDVWTVLSMVFITPASIPTEKQCKGVGITMEGIENNPVMYELLLELPWRKEKFTKEEWVKGYVKARYGTEDPMLLKAWEIMAATAYNCPEIRQGTTESVFCARPGETIRSVSSWGSAQMFYNARDFREAAECMLQVAEKYEGNNNFEYDLIDVVRQTLVDYGNGLQKEMVEAFKAGDKSSFGQKAGNSWLDTIAGQSAFHPSGIYGRALAGAGQEDRCG